MARVIDRLARRVNGMRALLPTPVYNGLRAIYRKARSRSQSRKTHSAAMAYTSAVASHAPLQSGHVLYESFHGKSFNCSPAAICLALLDDPAYAHLTHIWAVNDPAVLPEDLRARENVTWVLRRTPAYGDALATAGTIITNTTLEPFFARREGQVYANTWHGVPLKRMFRFEGTKITRHANSQRNFLQASHLLMPNAYTADALMRSADVDDATRHKVINTGAPRVDLTLSPDRDALRAQLGIAPECQVIMVAPTWRGSIGHGTSDTPEIDALLARLNELDPARYTTFVQMHDFVAAPNTGARALPAGLTTNQFLAVVDILITDYSSIMFDFFATGRQVVLFVYDYDRYIATRGLIADLDTLPAPTCHHVGAAMDAVSAGVRSDADPRFAAARDLYFGLDDGQATARAIAAVFGTAPVPTTPTRPRIVIFGGAWKNNGITSSMTNLLDALGQLEVDVYLVTSGVVIDQTQEYADNISRVHPDIHIIHRTGGMNLTSEERGLLDGFYASNAFSSADQEATLRMLFARESRRMFGDMAFDVAIDFSGYARFWSMLIAATDAKRRVIYQHNDMLSEATIRFDILHGVFATYKYYDAVVSVSPATAALNAANLAQHYTSPDQITSVRNMIDPAHIMAAAADPLPDDLPLPDGPTRFVSVGRMSAEKAQDRMIIALADLRARGHDAQLVLIGDGPLRATLAGVAARHGMTEHVIFAGHRSNPFAILARCDCFVLSSDYEGQPMVLLEALCLGLPIVATDIAGTRSVLDRDGGQLVDPSIAGVTAGMLDHLTEHAIAQPFDGTRYCTDVMQEFMDRVMDRALAPRAPAQDDTNA